MYGMKGKEGGSCSFAFSKINSLRPTPLHCWKTTTACGVQALPLQTKIRCDNDGGCDMGHQSLPPSSVAPTTASLDHRRAAAEPTFDLFFFPWSMRPTQLSTRSVLAMQLLCVLLDMCGVDE